MFSGTGTRTVDISGGKDTECREIRQPDRIQRRKVPILSWASASFQIGKPVGAEASACTVRIRGCWVD